jgi:hypothetical protein
MSKQIPAETPSAPRLWVPAFLGVLGDSTVINLGLR